jgi:hypothetical protein
MRAWMHRNLATQGYCLSEPEERALAVGLRFSTGLCLALVIAGLVLQSAALIVALVPIGALAGFTARHPFDHLWNGAVRHAFHAPALPPNPTRRRHAFAIGTAWLAVVGILLAAGATVAALALGGLLVAACATVTATGLCLPSEMLAWRERRHTSSEAVTA